MYEKLGGRKLLMTVLLAGVSIGIEQAGGAGLSDNLKELLQFLFLGFVGGNVGEHFAKRNTSKLPPLPVSPVINPKLDELHKKMDELKGGLGAPAMTEELKTKLQALTNSSALGNQASSTILTKLDQISRAVGLNLNQ